VSRVTVRRRPDGTVEAARLDGRPLSDADREEARRLAEAQEEDDPILTPVQWFPVFRACVLAYYRDHPDHDRMWLKDHHPELYRCIVVQENLIDAFGTVQFSELMKQLSKWRSLMLQAEFATAEDVKKLFGGEVMTSPEFRDHGIARQK